MNRIFCTSWISWFIVLWFVLYLYLYFWLVCIFGLFVFVKKLDWSQIRWSWFIVFIPLWFYGLILVGHLTYSVLHHGSQSSRPYLVALVWFFSKVHFLNVWENTNSHLEQLFLQNIFIFAVLFPLFSFSMSWKSFFLIILLVLRQANYPMGSWLTSPCAI